LRASFTFHSIIIGFGRRLERTMNAPNGQRTFGLLRTFDAGRARTGLVSWTIPPIANPYGYGARLRTTPGAGPRIAFAFRIARPPDRSVRRRRYSTRRHHRGRSTGSPASRSAPESRAQDGS
jgi:hypothetical protein